MSSPVPVDRQPVPGDTLPIGVLAASVMCWIVGLVTLYVAVTNGVPGLRDGGGTAVLFLAIGVAVGVAVCGAGALIGRRRRLGVLVLVLAWATPALMALLQGRTPRGGPLLILVALVLAGANWKNLR